MKRALTPFNLVCLLLLIGGVLAYLAVGRPQVTPVPPQYSVQEEVRDVQVKLYLSDPQMQGFRTETRDVRVARETPSDVAQAAAKALVEAAQQEGQPGVFPKDAEVPRVWVRGEHLIVDLPAAYARINAGTSGEHALLCSLTLTLLEVPGAKDVTFLVAGRNEVTLLGHLDLSSAFTRQDCTI